MSNTTPPTVIAPRQPRSRKTLERLVRAGLQILEEEGPAGVTVQAVVARARSSVGSFYARFGGKDDLLAHLREHIREHALTEWDEVVSTKSWAETSSLPDVAAGVIDLLLEVRARWDSGLRATEGLSQGAADYDSFRSRVVEELAGRLLEHRSEVEHEKPEIAVRVGLWAAFGAIDHARGGTPVGDITPEVLRTECKELLLSYLMGSAHGRDGQVEFFDVWG